MTKLRDNFYVYEWFNVDTGEVFYVGKGRNNRYKNVTQRNQYFKNYYSKYKCDARIVKHSLTEDEAFEEEKELIKKYRDINQCKCNLTEGGEGSVFPEGSWNNLYLKLRTLYYAGNAMDDMPDEINYDPQKLKTKSLEELKTLYDDYYKFKEIEHEYIDFKEMWRPFCSSPFNAKELSAFEVEMRNKEIIILTDIISNVIIKQNDEFSDLLNCENEIDYICADIDTEKFISLMFIDNDYYNCLTKVIIDNLWALKRSNRITCRKKMGIQVNSFYIEDNWIYVKFDILNDSKRNRVKLNLYDLVWGILCFKDKSLTEILYEEILFAPFIQLQ